MERIDHAGECIELIDAALAEYERYRFQDRLNTLAEARWVELDATDLSEDEKTRKFLEWFDTDHEELHT